MDQKEKTKLPAPKNPHHTISLRRVLLTSFWMNVSDVLVNLVVALLSGSVTVLSQSLEGFADMIAAGLLLVGYKKSNKLADPEHPYGYGRELYFWNFLSGLGIFGITATMSFYFGYQRYINPEPIMHLPLALLALTIALITNGYAFTLSYRRLLGKRGVTRIFQSFMHSSLIETKTTFVLDLMGTVASLLGLLALTIYWVTGDLRFDGIGAMVTGLALAFFSFFILRGAKELLVGQSAPPKTLETITETVESFKEVIKVLELRTLYLGSDKLLIDLEVHLEDGLTTDQIELLIDHIERHIKSKVAAAKYIQIELETPDVV